MKLSLLLRRKRPVAVVLSFLIVWSLAPSARAAFRSTLEGKHAIGTNWVNGPLVGWQELDPIPMRTLHTGGPATNQVIVISFDHTKSSGTVRGIEDLTGFSNSPNVIITSPPTLSAPAGVDIWSYTFTIAVTDGQAATVQFFGRLAAGSHLFTGSSLSLSLPGPGQLQISKASAAPGNPDLVIAKSGPSQAKTNQIITYAISYTNKITSPDTARGVQVSDVLPSQVTYVPNSANNKGRLVGNTLTWDLGNLAPGKRGLLTYKVIVTNNIPVTTTFANFAQILSSHDDASPADNSASVTTTVVVTPTPLANDDFYSMRKNQTLTVPAPGVLNNDSNALSASLLGGPVNGSLTFNTNGSFTYTPDTNFVGADIFAYRAFNSTNTSGPAIVTIDVTNIPPVAINDFTNTLENVSVTITPLGNDSDADADPLTIVSVAVTNGTALIVGGTNVVFTPATNFTGTATIGYTITDGSGGTNSALITVTVIAVNDAPIANNQSVTMPEDTTTNLVLTATDAEGGPLTFIIVTGPSNGVISGFNPSTGALTYTPNINFNGADSFTFVANDGTTNSGEATVSITVLPLNDSPVANDQSVVTVKNISLPLMLTASDADGDPLTFAIVTGPTNGSLSGFNTNTGALTYTPTFNYTGPDSFTFRVNDGQTDSATATVSITVKATNTPPVANSQTVNATEDTPQPITVTGSDIDGDPLTFVIVTPPTNGVISGFNSSTGALIYTPETNFNGGDSFTFLVNDGSTNSAVATVGITVTPVNDAPVAVNDSYTTAEETPLNVSSPGVLANDSDAETNTLTAVLVSGPTHGSLTLNPDGSFSYTPAADYAGPDSFTYQANDGATNSGIATVSLTVTPVNDAPVAVNDSYTTAEETPLNVSAPGVLANDSDAETNTLTAVLVSGPTHGSLTLNPDGSFSYTPAADYTGPDSFTYRANDGATNSGIATVSLTVTPVNDAPVAVNDSYTTAEETPLNVSAPGVLANDTDAETNTLTAVLVSGPTHGSLTLNVNGSFTYTPATDYIGPDSFTYQANDGATNSGIATVSLTVTPVNDAPVAANDSYTTAEETPLNVSAPGVLANDTDAETNTLTAVLVSGPTHGSLTLNVNGSFTYTPATDYIGPDSFTYQANDGATNSGIATVSLTVTPVNDAPVAVNDSYTTAEETPLNVSAPGVLANDTDAETNTLTAVLVSGPTHGSLTLNVNGSFTYTPATDYIGPDSFTYRANDGTTNGGIATVNLTVTPVNDAPVAVNDSYTTAEDTLLNVSSPGVLANDTDADTNTLTAVLVSGPTHGSLTLNPNGSFTYTPAADYAGPDSFTYRANDGTTNSGIATVNLTVTPVNDAPVAVNDSYTTAEDTPLNVSSPGVLANDTDADTNTLTAVLVSGPTHGSLTLNPNGSFTYTPAADYAGPDSFTYRANDGTTNSGIATVNLTVTPVNDAPVAVNDSYTTAEDTPLNVSSPGVLANDTDAETNTLTAVLVSGPTHGSLTLNVNGSFTYTPATDYIGPDSFTYQANDGATNSGIATVSLTVTPVNDAPVAVNDSYTTAEETPLNVSAPGVLANDTDAETNTLTAVLVSGPTHGSLTLNAGGSFTYTPAADYAGPDSFTYRANDGATNSGIATVNLTVTPVNDAPVAVNDSYTTAEDTPLNVSSPGVLANDTDAETNTLTAVLVSGPTHGSLTLNVNGSFTYTPATDYIGPDSFSYRANDGATNSGIATVNLTVTPVNDAPVAVNDSYTTAEDTPLNVSSPGVLANDTDADTNTLTAVLTSGPTHGSLTLNVNGSFTYTPATDYIGPDSFTYRANDGTTNSGIATVNLTVTPVNDAPVAVNDSYTTTEDTPLNVSSPGVLANDTDADTNTLTAVLVSGPTHGSLTLNADGSFTYTPAGNYTGPDSFSYRANDGTTNSGVATVSLTVSPMNDAPVAINDTLNTQMDTPLMINPLVNDSDADGDILTIISASPTNGTVTIVGGTNLAFTPASNFLGTAYINYAINDGNGGNASAMVTVSVTSAPAVQFGILQGTNSFNPQSGLFEQRVTVTNAGTMTAAAIRLLVGGLRSGVSLYNASGTNVDQRPYVQYNAPLNPGQTVRLTLEFYVPDRRPFTNSLEAQVVLPTASTNSGSGVAIDRAFVDSRIPGEPRNVIEFTSIPGRTYTIIYSDDGMATWQAATPSITASANRTQWYDDGPPKTASEPSSTTSRFYRVILAP